MVSVVVVLHWQQSYEKYSGHSGAYLNFILEVVVVVVGNKSMYSTQAKMLVPWSQLLWLVDVVSLLSMKHT